MRRLSVGMAIGLATVVAAQGAMASADDYAERHVKSGIELRRRGDDQGALVEFTKAYQAVKSPRAAAQLALCEQSLANWADAYEHMREALAVKEDPWIKKNWATLMEAFVTIRQHTARLEVVGSPDGADVSVAGRSVGRLPMEKPVRINAGVVDLEVTAAGHKASQRSLNLAPEGYQRVLIRLEQVHVGSPVGVVAAVPFADSASPEERVVAVPFEPAPAESSDAFYTRPWFWVAVGAVVVAAGVAVSVVAFGGNTYPSGATRSLPQ